MKAIDKIKVHTTDKDKCEDVGGIYKEKDEICEIPLYYFSDLDPKAQDRAIERFLNSEYGEKYKIKIREIANKRMKDEIREELEKYFPKDYDKFNIDLIDESDSIYKEPVPLPDIPRIIPPSLIDYKGHRLEYNILGEEELIDLTHSKGAKEDYSTEVRNLIIDIEERARDKAESFIEDELSDEGIGKWANMEEFKFSKNGYRIYEIDRYFGKGE